MITVANAAAPLSGPSRFLVLSAAGVAALGGFLFGFDTAVISGTTGALKALYGLTGNELGFTVASGLIGTILGSLLASAPSILTVIAAEAQKEDRRAAENAPR